MTTAQALLRFVVIMAISWIFMYVVPIKRFVTLHVTALALLVHQFFFLRAPLSIPGPPLGAEELPGGKG